MQTKSKNVNRINEAVLGLAACHFLKGDVNAKHVSEIWQWRTAWFFNKKVTISEQCSRYVTPASRDHATVKSEAYQKRLRWLETSDSLSGPLL